MDNYVINNLPDYFKQYERSVKDPKKFWGNIAEDNFVWEQKWSKVVNYDIDEARIEWFRDAKLNITENCIDRHLKYRARKTAIIWEPNNPDEEAISLTYQDLYDRVGKMANVLRSQGVKKGDRVCIYLPMIVELPVVMLACARIGAVHVVVFAGFSANALASRINDCGCEVVVCADGSYRGNKEIDLKGIVDEALEQCPSVKKVLVVKRTSCRDENRARPLASRVVGQIFGGECDADNGCRRSFVYSLYFWFYGKAKRYVAHLRRLYGLYGLYL